MFLASGSETRARLLQNAGLNITVSPPRIDEESIRDSLISEGAAPRDIADFLAEAKAKKMSRSAEKALVLGCDQVLALKGRIFSKPGSAEDACEQLHVLSGQTHSLLSAAVIYENQKPVWRHVGQVRLTMRSLSPKFISNYVERNWDSIRHSVGCYKIEEEGIRLFTDVSGNYFHVLGLPLLELINYLVLRGDLEV